MDMSSFILVNVVAILVGVGLGLYVRKQRPELRKSVYVFCMGFFTSQALHLAVTWI